MLYDRKIKYLEVYDKEVKLQSVGFVKLENSKEGLRIQIKVDKLRNTDNLITGIMLKGERGEGLLGELRIENGKGCAEFEKLESAHLVRDVGYEDLEEIFIQIDADRVLKCRTKEKKREVQAAQMNNEAASELIPVIPTQQFQEQEPAKQEYVERERRPVERERRPVEGERRAVEPEQGPVEGEQRPVEPEQRPVEGERRPVEGEQRPVERERRAVEPEQRPVESEQRLVERERRAVEPERRPVEREWRPVEGGQRPVERERRLVEGERRPVEWEQGSGVKHEDEMPPHFKERLVLQMPREEEWSQISGEHLGNKVVKGIRLEGLEKKEKDQKKPEAPIIQGMKNQKARAATKWQQIENVYPHIRPFEDEREYLQLKPEDFVILSNKYYALSSNSFLLHGYYNYEHLILCKEVKGGEERYFVGVPGNYYTKEKQVAVLFGFESFEGKTEPANSGDFGYYMISVEL